MLTSEISFYLLATACFVLLLEKAIFLTAKINIMYTRFLLDWLICKHISLHWKNTAEKVDRSSIFVSYSQAIFKNLSLIFFFSESLRKHIDLPK